MNLDIDVVAIAGGFIFSIIWLVRLESKVLYLEKSTDAHWKKLDEFNDKLDSISQSLARMEGKLENK